MASPGQGQVTLYLVEIETWGDGAASYPVEVLAALPSMLTELGARGPAVSAGGVAGGVGASFGLEGGSFPSTLRAGLRIFETARRRLGLSHAGIARAVVLTDDMHRRELEQEPETYLGVTELARTLGVSRQRIAELRARPDFPAPAADLAAGPVWRGSTLQRFVQGWDRRPGRPRRPAVATTDR